MRDQTPVNNTGNVSAEDQTPVDIRNYTFCNQKDWSGFGRHPRNSSPLAVVAMLFNCAVWKA